MKVYSPSKKSFKMTSFQPEKSQDDNILLDKREDKNMTAFYNNVLKSTVTQADLGAFYTPPVLSNWIATLISKYHKDASKSIIDPASGDGALLAPLSNICTNKIHAVDINASDFSTVKNRIKGIKRLSLHELDTLNPSKSTSTLNFWKRFFKEEEVGVVVSNPPWGGKISQNSKELLRNGFTLASGQYDSYELFMELMIEASVEKTFLIFIIPDSIFLPEHKSLRELILRKTKIHLLSRLGEGFFKNVNRGTSVLLLERGLPDKEHVVRCMRLNKVWRDNVLRQNHTLEEAFGELSHSVRQERFLNNSESLFDIDILDTEKTISKIDQIAKMNLSQYLTSGRGVEISKSGKVFTCNRCNNAHPVPRKKDYINCKCGNTIIIEDEEVKKLISNKPTKNSVPLIVGEDIKRYSCKASRYLQVDIKGIQYKDVKSFNEKKLLIRKTGIGIKSSIDTSGAHTNQVVFHYIAKKEKHIPEFIIEYVQGVLSSRVLMAYYLQRYGDNEWRSHPYITQKVISQLPIPDFSKSEDTYLLAQEIASNVRKMNNTTAEVAFNIDLQIEKLVVKLFSLTDEDCKWMLQVLQGAQQLEPIRALMLEDYKMIIG